MFNNSPSTLLEHRVIQKMLDPSKNYSSKNTSTSFRKYELEVCIDLGDGTTGFIKLDANSNPQQCALQFCEDYNIDKSVAPLLAQSILNQLKQEATESKSNSPMIKHKLSQSMIQESKPQLKQITHDIMNRRMNRRRQSESACGNRIKYKKNTEPSSVVESQQQFSYQPKINEISQQIVSKLNKKNIVLSTQENQKKKEQKIAKLKKQNQFKEICECSFRPKINPISQKVDVEIHRNKRFSAGKRYQKLYVDSILQQQSKQHSRKTSFQKNSFKPEINKISKTIMSGISFEQRQQKFRKKAQSKPVIIFKPKTGRHPKQRNLNQLPIGQYLYEQGKQRQNQRVVASATNSRRHSIVSNKSQELFNNLKINKLKQIFQLLDFQGSGTLQFDELNFQNVDKQILNLFSPIFQQMRQIQVSLNLEEFIEAGSRLIHNLTPYQRGILFNTKKKVQIPQQFPFHPQINKNTKPQKANRKDIYIRCLMQKKQHKQRIQHSKQEIVKNQLYQCTFKPKINKFNRFI